MLGNILFINKYKLNIMKNLLETEFVIENCTLSQRLAIKAYCDDKQIKVYENSFTSDSCKNYPHLTFNKSMFVGTEKINDRKLITFSELIQFLDQYQPETEFKIGDIVVVESWYHNKNVKFPQTCKLKDIGVETDCAPFAINLNKDHWGSNGTWNFKKGEFRHATPEEIKKWKEENEIKLPKIADYSGMVTTDQADTKILKWGCTEISISTIKELLEVGLDHITIKGYHIVDSEIKQIKKFIEHNKL